MYFFMVVLPNEIHLRNYPDAVMESERGVALATTTSTTTMTNDTDMEVETEVEGNGENQSQLSEEEVSRAEVELKEALRCVGTARSLESITRLKELVVQQHSQGLVTDERKKRIEALCNVAEGRGNVATKITTLEERQQEESPYMSREQILRKIAEVLPQANKSIIPQRITNDGKLVSYPEILWDRNQPVLHRVAGPNEFEKHEYLRRARKVCNDFPEGQLVYDCCTNAQGDFSTLVYNRLFFHVVSYGDMGEDGEINCIPLVSFYKTLPPSEFAHKYKKIELFVRGDPMDHTDRRVVGQQRILVMMDEDSRNFISGKLALACVPKEEMEKKQPSVLGVLIGRYDGQLREIPDVEYIPQMAAKAKQSDKIAQKTQNVLQGTLRQARLKKVDTETIGYNTQKAAFEERKARMQVALAKRREQRAQTQTQETQEVQEVKMETE